MYNLPKDIQYIIYKYDNTYKIIYNEVIKELIKVFRIYNINKYSYLFRNDLEYNVNAAKQNIFDIIKFKK